MSLEGKSPEEIEALAALADEVLGDPKYAMPFKRMLKAQNPQRSIPDVELEARVAAELQPRDKKIEDLEKDKALGEAERRTNELYEALRDTGAVSTRASFAALCKYAQEKGFMVNESGLRMAAQHQANELEAAEPTPAQGGHTGFEIGQGDLGKAFMKDPKGTALNVAAKAMDELKKLRPKGQSAY